MGYPTAIQLWVEHFLSNRTTALAFDGKMEDLSLVQTGIPQGSPASPILFLLYLSHLSYKLTTHHPRSWTPIHIDHVAIVIRSKSKGNNV
jgi:hypothetical protein